MLLDRLYAIHTPLSQYNQLHLLLPVWLRNLTLVARYGTPSYISGTDERLLTWLTHEPCLAPLLTTVKLYDIFSPSSHGLVDQAFRHFTMREGLERLTLYANAHVQHRSISCAAFEALLPSTADDRLASSPLDRSHLADEARQRPTRRSFERLKELHLVVASCTLLPGPALLLPSLTVLRIVVLAHPDDDADDDVDFDDLQTSSVFAPLASLSQLRKLDVVLDVEMYVAWADLLALRSLIELRELDIDNGVCEDAHDADLAAPFSPLQKFQQLVVWMDMEDLPSDALRALGEALPQPRHLELESDWSLCPAVNETAGGAPLFPSLRYLATRLGI